MFSDLYDKLKKSEKRFNYYKTSFVTGDSPITHDIDTKLSGNGIEGFIQNLGANAMTYTMSSNGIAFSDAIYLPAGDTHQFRGESIKVIKTQWIADTGYTLEIRGQ